MPVAFFALILLLADIGPGPATLAQFETHPVGGRATMLRFERDGQPAVGIAVTARYRENADPAIAHQQMIGATGTDGTLSWVPEDAGVVVLSWEGGTRNVSVLHAGVPFLGVAIAVLAGILLLGGSILTFFRMRDEEADFVDTEIPKPET